MSFLWLPSSLRNALLSGSSFDPRSVPEVAAGYFWDPTNATGAGATLTVPEGNGKSTYDMITPMAGTAPTPGTLNGQVVAQYANGSPDQLMRTNATVTRGWTGATYFAAWIQTGAATGGVFGHWRTANNLLLQLNAGDSRVNASDGGAAVGNRFAAVTFGATPWFIEALFDPAQVDVGRLRLFVDRVELTPTLTSSIGTTLADTSEYITAGGTVGDNTTLNYTADFKTGVVYLANGIPSAAARDRLYAFRALK
jgi:hypothetical protein